MGSTVKKLVELVVRVTDEAEGTLKGISGDLDKLDKNFDKTAKGATKLTTATDKTKKEIKGLGEEVKKTEPKLSKLGTVFDRVKKKVRGLGAETTKSKRSLKDLQSSTGGLVGTFTKVAVAVASIAFPVVQAAKFQRVMAEVQAISGATGEDLTNLTNIARKMGAETEYSALEAASGLKYLTMAGLSAAEAVEALPGVLNLAQAGAMELGQAADIATNILTGFGLGVGQLGRVNDVLVQTFTNTNSTLAELGTAMAYVAPVAAGLGADFEDLTASLGLLHSAGIKGSFAGTTLRGILTRLVAPTSQTRKVMEALGERIGQTSLNMRDANGNFVGFTALVKQLEEAGASTTEIMRMLGQRAGPGLAALLLQGSDALRDMTELNKQATGRAREIAKVMHENVVGSLKAFKSVIIDVSITVGNKLLKALDLTIKKVTYVVKAFGKWAAVNPKLTSTLVILGVSVTAVASAIALLNAATLVLTGSVLKLSVILGIIVKGFSLVVAVVTSVITLVGSLFVLLAGLTFSKTFNAWVRDFEIFGITVGELITGMIAFVIAGFEGMFARGHAILLVWASLPKLILGNVLAYVSSWAIKLVGIVGKIPGLGKLLGWDKDDAKIKQVLRDIEELGKDIVETTKQRTKAASKAYQEELSFGKDTLSMMRVDILARAEKRAEEERYQALRKEAIDLEQQIAKATKEVVDARAEGFEKLETAAKKAMGFWQQQRETLDALVLQGDEALKTLGDSIEQNVNRIWEETLNTDVVDQYKKQLEALTQETEMFGTDNTTLMADISGKITAAQAKAIENGIAQISSMYDQQIEDYEAFQTAQMEAAYKSEAARIQAENNLKNKVAEFSLKTYEKKKEYFEKATESLRSELEKAKAAELETAQKIMSINEQMQLSKLSAAEKIRELRRRAMSEEEKYADKTLEYNDLISQAQAAVGEDYEKAIEYAKKAEQVAGTLITTSKDGSIEVEGAISKIQEAQQVMGLAAAAETEALEGTLAGQREYAQSIQATYEDLTLKLNSLKAVLAEGLNTQLTVDQVDFDAAILRISEQKAIEITALVNFEEAQIALKTWIEETKAQVNEVVIPIKLEGEEKVLETLTTTLGLKDKLLEDATLQIKTDQTVDDTTEKLLKLAGYKVDLSEGVAVIKVESSEETEGTVQTLKAAKVAMDTLDEKKTIIVSEEITTPDFIDLQKGLEELPSEEAPKVVGITTDATAALEVAEVYRKKLVEEIPDSKTVAIHTPQIEERKEAVNGFSRVVSAIKENIVITTIVKGVEEATAQLQKLGDVIRALPKETNLTVTKTVVTKYVTEGAPGDATKAQTGMRLSGYGGGDRRLILAEDGEWVIRKEAVRKYGDAFLSRLNSGILPKFKTGGMILGTAASSLSEEIPTFRNGGKVLPYADFAKIVEALNALGGRLEMLLEASKPIGLKQDLYKPMLYTTPSVKGLERLLKTMGLSPLPGVSDNWKDAFKGKLRDQIDLYESHGGDKAYNKSQQSFYADVRKNTTGTISNAEIDYGFMLSKTFEGTKGMVESFAELKESYEEWNRTASALHKERLAEAFNVLNLEDAPPKGSKKDISDMGIGVHLQKFATGGVVRAAEGFRFLEKVPNVASSENIRNNQTIKHTIDFNFGTRTVGPFEGPRNSVSEFLSAMSAAKGRA